MSVNFSLLFINSKKPKISSNITTAIAKINACFSKNGILKTAGEKYSSNLNEKPTTSTAFTKPERMKIKPTIILNIFFSIVLKFLRWKMDEGSLYFSFYFN